MTPNAGTAGFGGSRFSSAGSFGHSGFGQRSSMFSGNGSGRYGNGYGRGGFGYGGYRHYGYGWGRGGWGGGWGGDGLWFLDDLFGLALNFSSFALNPWSPFATLGADLIGDGVQALGNLDNNNGQGSYNSSYAPGPYDYQQQYSNDQQNYAPLCGSQFSDENPGCVQQQ
jgi:hypothetical protein